MADDVPAFVIEGEGKGVLAESALVPGTRQSSNQATGSESLYIDDSIIPRFPEF